MRRAAALIALVAALPVAALAASGAEVTVPATASFTPPTTPMVLTRTVWRTLYDGKQIIVRRSYLVTFEPVDGGYTVDGTPLAVEVEVPPALEPIARMERARPDIDTFPLMLDAHGLIRGDADSSPGAVPGGGVATAQGMIASSSLDRVTKRDAIAVIAQLAASGGSIPWPRDLFNPLAMSNSDIRAVSLPDGSSGTVTINQSVDGRFPDGLPRKVSRVVATELGGTSRTSREEWTIAPVAGP